MDKKRQQIEMAEFCGWKDISWDGRIGIHPFTTFSVIYIPDYLTDLNAIHEAENLLSDVQLVDYQGRLTMICSTRYVRAKAFERTEALLKTIGKWKNE